MTHEELMTAFRIFQKSFIMPRYKEKAKMVYPHAKRTNIYGRLPANPMRSLCMTKPMNWKNVTESLWINRFCA